MENMDKIWMLLPFVVLLFAFSQSQERRCDVPADVVFLMDASDSIKDTEWEQEKEFVTALIDNLEVDRYAIHVGVIVYSTQIGQIIDLQPFKTKNQLKTLLQQAVQINQGTDTAKAISKMIEMSENQGRIEAGAKQIAVVITDGRSTDVSATIREARRARLTHKIEMVALGVGNETFLQEMMEIAGPENSNRLFQVKDFGQLRDVVAQLQELICEIIPPTTTAATTTMAITTTAEMVSSPNIPPFPCARPADVVFLIDGSYSISPPDWVKGKQFVSYIINSVDVGLESVHVGIIVYSSDIGDVVPLQPFKNKSELREAALGLKQPPIGRTNTALGLQRVRHMIKSQGRPDVPHIAIVITDGMSSSPSETYDQATAAKNEGVVVFVVGVGDRVLQQEVEDMASSLTSLFSATDFKTLLGMVQLLRDNICTAIQVTSTPRTVTEAASTTPATRPQIPELCQECLVEGGVGFNPLPSDCEKYVLCVPQGVTYMTEVKSCPFGMFWSNVTVSCLDARFVDCPADKCRTLANMSTYSSGSPGCRSYFSCSSSRSTPMCCEAGYRYFPGSGCSPDPSCQEPCPLNITIYNQGSCRYRVDPASYFSYLEIVPGQGHVKRLCQAGQVYSQSNCSCTSYAVDAIHQIACTAAVNLTFDGSFKNYASQPQPIDVQHVSLTNTGSAYFDGNSSLTFPITSSKDMGDNLVIKIKFRKRPEIGPAQAWNNLDSWGFHTWFNNASNHGNIHSITVNKSGLTEPDLAHPTGAETHPLEVIMITKNGTIIRDPRYDVKDNRSWPNISQSAVNGLHLGNLGSLTTPVIESGIIYVPNGKKKILIQDSAGAGVSGAVKPTWKVVSVGVDGQAGAVEESGTGSVPITIQEKYGFDLRPPVVERWLVLAPGGVVLQHGVGPVPDEVLNRYAGFTPGTLVKVFERGDIIERWQVSKPDGSQMQEGRGSIPQNIVETNKLDKALSPVHKTTVWSIIDSDGKLMESGTGEIPNGLGMKYLNSPSVSLIKSTSSDGGDPHWEITRPTGVKVIEGRGSLPQGISRFIKGEMPLPQVSYINKWTVTMPDGTVRTGTGQIPQEILNVFHQTTPAPGKVTQTGSQVINRWTITLPDGTVRTGVGPVPEDIKNMMNSQRTNIEKQWQATLPDGTVKSGTGDMPGDLLGMIGGQGNVGFGSRVAQTTRTRRAINGGPQTMDLLSNCGPTPSEAPSVHLFASDRDITLNLITEQSQSGVSLTLPVVKDGENDVTFIYDGVDLTGLANGYVRKLPLKGRVQTRAAPVTVGQCKARPDNHFIGEINQLELYFCLP